MCLLICIRDGRRGMVLAANRDERYDRPSRAPFVWRRRPRILAGRDERAGGTWLAVSETGLAAAVTNRPTADGEDPSRPSRGRLPLIACRSASAREARRALGEHLESVRYNGFNLLVGDAEAAFVIECPAGGAEITDVGAGVYVLANAGWNDSSDPRVARAHELLAGRGVGREPSCEESQTEALMAVCRDHHGRAGAGSLCMHGGSAGTVSSTILWLDPAGRLSRYLHADGPPCRSEYRRLSLPRRGP